MEAECRECGCQFDVDPDENEHICPSCYGMDISVEESDDWES